MTIRVPWFLPARFSMSTEINTSSVRVYVATITVKRQLDLIKERRVKLAAVVVVVLCWRCRKRWSKAGRIVTAMSPKQSYCSTATAFCFHSFHCRGVGKAKAMGVMVVTF